MTTHPQEKSSTELLDSIPQTRAEAYKKYPGLKKRIMRIWPIILITWGVIFFYQFVTGHPIRDMFEYGIFSFIFSMFPYIFSGITVAVVYFNFFAKIPNEVKHFFVDTNPGNKFISSGANISYIGMSIYKPSYDYIHNPIFNSLSCNIYHRR